MEWYESLKKHISYRLSNPFTPAFLLSWSVLNFKTILTVFSSVPLSEKIQFLDATYSHETLLDTGYMQGLVLPAALAFLFVLVSPWFTGAVGLYWKWQKNKVKGWSISLDDKTPRSAAEFVDLREKYSERVRDKDSEVERLNAKSESFLATIKRLEETIEGLDSRDAESRSNHQDSLKIIADLNAEKSRLTKQLKEQEAESKSHMFAVVKLQQQVQDLEFQLSTASENEEPNWHAIETLVKESSVPKETMQGLKGLLNFPAKKEEK